MGYVAQADPSNWRSLTELFVGFIHMLTAVIWFGAIFYVHLFVGPRSLTSGLPRSERILGLGSLALVGATGAVLTWLRINQVSELWNTTFGVVLLVKMGAFSAMVLIAIVTNTYVHRVLRRNSSAVKPDEENAREEQANAPHVIYQGQAYDVSSSKLWQGGRHMGRHKTGEDLTTAMEGAPHGPEVLERMTKLATLAVESPKNQKTNGAQRLLVGMAYTVLALMLLVLFCLAYWNWGPPLVHAAQPWTEDQASACIACHKKATPGIYADWSRSQHAHGGVSCLHCHSAQPGDKDISQDHFKQYQDTDNKWSAPKYRVAISAVVTPKDCARCHPEEAKEYSASKHANTLQIIWQFDPWLNYGLNSDFERTNGCYACHGTVLKMDKNGRLDPSTWPNVGVGRLNLDDSRGSCSSCHTRHRFSLAEARKPDTCGQCHLGPDHPQWEIYNESKHGSIMRSDGAKWNWDAAPSTWTPGVDYRTPTCAACHMSGSGGEPTTHDVTRRLSWELQAPLTVRPRDFKPWPSGTPWQEERRRMQNICLQCHGSLWVKSHFAQMDKAVSEYNDIYYLPAKKKLDQIYAAGLLPKDAFFKSPLWVEFYELWHHEGRRARMGAAMMAPDYSWWHGFYECKKRYVKFMREADHRLKTNTKLYVAPDWPAGTGSTQKPPQLFPKSR